ncbi:MULTISPECIES: PfkB family carbohydrate kinase [unclassified Roseofilum]|uniref:PfkB family carbohydrate kinase n=1 Tax=unclassified Roseofilum TaxID=2620099 RepID=UPI001B08BAC5|nr:MULTISPECIES: PfkB family carbohydrate kinase [unclassified Roseofilum]MBP0011204.1 sugar kinase [Roseofilum sp. Belize Diploria]MBP0035655.1 sugar kinase [Roseofilum sp. Belize BBD 4]
MEKSALFVGLATLDFLYLTPKIPQVNEKLVAVDYTVAAGGPATNAAISFEYLRRLHKNSGSTQLLASVGNHPLSRLIRTDLEVYGVHCIDLDSQRIDPPPVSSILVTQPGGDRAVISINATHAQGAWNPDFSALLDNIQVLLIDGHQMAMSQELAQIAKAGKIPIIIDGGSWKPGFEGVLALADTVITSANFYPPGCDTHEQVMAYLIDLGIPQIAITQGEGAIAYYTQGKQSHIAVPQGSAVDTLGAGDILHGAFCYYSLELDFAEALAQSAKIASASVQQFGTRAWMKGEGGGIGEWREGF